MKDEVKGRFIVYMSRVLSNARINYLCKQKRTIEHEVLPGVLPDQPVYDEVLWESASLNQAISDKRLRRVLETLTENEAAVLFRMICMEQSAKETASEMGLALKSVYRIKSCALRKLQKQLIGGDLHE